MIIESKLPRTLANVACIGMEVKNSIESTFHASVFRWSKKGKENQRRVLSKSGYLIPIGLRKNIAFRGVPGRDFDILVAVKMKLVELLVPFFTHPWTLSLF